MSGGNAAVSVRVHGLDALPVGKVAHVLPSALTVDEDGHVWISRSADVIDTRARFGRIEVHRKGPDDYRISVPWSVTTRWVPSPNAGTGDRIKASAITHYPLPWSRGLWWLTQRSRVARLGEDWLSQRNRSMSWAVTAAAWVAPFAFLAVGIPLPHLAVFWIVWGASNFPPIHSAIEALWTRNRQRFSEPGKYVRPWEADKLRRENVHLREVVPAADVLPTALRYRPRSARPHVPVGDKVKGFFSAMMSERSIVPQFSMTMAVTAFGFITKHVMGPVIDPLYILVASWGASQFSTFHSIYEAVQMKRHGASWRESVARVTNPTAFPAGPRFGSSVDYSLYLPPVAASPQPATPVPVPDAVLPAGPASAPVPAATDQVRAPGEARPLPQRPATAPVRPPASPQVEFGIDL